MALICKPEFLIMDEPSNGVDPVSRMKLYSHLKSLKNTSVLLITHRIDEAEKICRRIAILYSGEILCFDTPKKIIADHGLILMLQLTPASPVMRDRVIKKISENFNFCR